MPSGPSHPAGSARSRTPLDRRLGAFVVVAGVLLAANNLLPYAGLRDDSCQTMFSGLSWSASSNNHLFMPQRALGDRWEYLEAVRAAIDPPAGSERAAYLADWLSREDRVVNVDAVRAVVWQLCREGHRVRLSYRDPITGRAMSEANACDGRFGSPSWWIPVRLYETDLPAPDEAP